MSKINKTFKNWEKRIKDDKINSICKPCWDLKYCPYGSLVEQFLIIEDSNYRCKIFGHQCPVFTVAEPFTETKELRNISKNIPQSVKFKVMRRDNNICQLCGKPVLDDSINFDHIVPWSKGGSSDPSNIRVLCEICNKKRGNDFEGEILIAHIREIHYDPELLSSDMVEDLLTCCYVGLYIRRLKGELTEIFFCSIIESNDLETDKFMYGLISNIIELLESDNPFLVIKRKMEILKFRWGITDGRPHSIEETCQKYKVDIEYYLEQENLLLRQLGFKLKINQINLQDYKKNLINVDELNMKISSKMDKLY